VASKDRLLIKPILLQDSRSVPFSYLQKNNLKSFLINKGAVPKVEGHDEVMREGDDG
jgi:hypothetical protein